MDLKQKYTMESNKEKLIRIIRKEYDVDIFENLRTKSRVEARCIFAYIMHTKHNVGYTAIARMFEKSHSTIIHYVKSFDNWIKYDPSFYEKYINIVKVYSEIGDFDVDQNYNSWYDNIILKDRVRSLEDKLNERLHRLMERIPKDKEDEMYDRFSIIVKMNC